MATQTQNDRRTPLYSEHMRLQARMIVFGGWEMPVQYSSIHNEHNAVRRTAGLFDVSHMGEFYVSGAQALGWLNRMIPNDLRRISPGRAQYTQLCNEAAGILDDLIVYWLEPEQFLLVVNAGNIAKDWQWLSAHCPPGVHLQDRSAETALLALQGPLAQDIVNLCSDRRLEALKPFHIAEVKLLGSRALIARTGYTGEDGIEIFVAAEDAVNVWQGLLEKGAAGGLKPAGLGARDTLRLEAALPLYGHELDEQTSPLEAGLGWSVRLTKDHFIGKQALVRQQECGLQKTLVGLKMCGRAIARQDYPVCHDGRPVGKVTSGTLAPFLGYPIAMTYVPPQLAIVGATLEVRIRDQAHAAEIVKLPFFRRPQAG